MNQTDNRKNDSTFFITAEEDRSVSGMIYEYHFETVQDMRALLTERLQGRMTDEEIFDAVKAAFRNKPKKDAAGGAAAAGELADFIYQM